ncbi:hypothetical protein K438DRAFT_1876120, partial [Mycena galopus ATCC 62051]
MSSSKVAFVLAAIARANAKSRIITDDDQVQICQAYLTFLSEGIDVPTANALVTEYIDFFVQDNLDSAEAIDAFRRVGLSTHKTGQSGLTLFQRIESCCREARRSRHGDLSERLGRI